MLINQNLISANIVQHLCVIWFKSGLNDLGGVLRKSKQEQRRILSICIKGMKTYILLSTVYNHYLLFDPEQLDYRTA